MSLLTQQTNANTSETYFLKVNAKIANISTINANTISTNALEAESISTNLLSAYEGTFSTFSTSQIVIDGQTLNANATELLLNGIPVATLSSLSSIADWALEPAISSVNMDGFNIVGASTISCQTIVAGQGVIAANLQVENGLFKNLVAFNSLFVSSNTSTISSLVLNADLGNFSTLEAGAISSGVIAASTLSVDAISVSSIIANSISTPSLFVSSINGAEFTSTTITVEVGSFSSLVANSISSLGAQIREALISTIVFSPSLNPSLGGVNVNLGLGGILGNVIGWGAGVLGAATGIVALGTSAFALASGRQTDYIDNTRYELVNGVTQLQFSTLGVPFSTIYRFNNSTDPERVPGQEIFISTVNPPGVAVRSVSDPIYTLSTPSSTIQAFGQWVPLPQDIINVSSFADASVSSLTVSTINGSVYPPVIPGNEDWALYPAVSTIAFSTSVPAVLQAGAGGNIGIVGTNIQLIGGFTDAKDNLIVSTISTGTIQGAQDNLFGLGIQGLVIQTQPTGQVYVSTSQTNVLGLLNTSTMTATNVQGRNGGISSLQVSSLAFTQAGAFGLSSLMFLSTAQLPGFGTSTTTYLNTDLSVGQNDIFAQQIRLGYLNPSSQPSEIIFHSPNNTQRAFNLGNGDQTIRIQSTANATTAGYLLDTLVNPPFFSTIANSTCMMAVFPSTTAGSLGVSTLAIIPPIQVFGSFYSSTSQTVAGANTITPLTYNSQSVNVGGLTFAGSTITVPIAGTYEINHSIQFNTTSGGTNPVYFWYKKNGADIPQTGSFITVANNAEDLGTISLFDTAAAGDQYACCIVSPDANMTAAFVPVSTIFPAVPSIITNIKRL